YSRLWMDHYLKEIDPYMEVDPTESIKRTCLYTDTDSAFIHVNTDAMRDNIASLVRSKGLLGGIGNDLANDLLLVYCIWISPKTYYLCGIDNKGNMKEIKKV